MSADELHIKATFPRNLRKGSCPALQKQEGDRNILGLFLENFVRVTSPLESQVELVGLCTDVKFCCCVLWTSLVIHSVISDLLLFALQKNANLISSSRLICSGISR